MLTQENKLLSIDTPLGKDVLLLARFRGQEALSELFHFDIDLFSEQQSISLEDIVGKNVTVSVFLADGSIRYFNGIISRFSQEHGNPESGSELQSSYYSATMVPWTWLLTRTSDSRIFQKLTVPDIVQKVFEDKGFTDFRMNLQGQHEEREYTVQYRESDFNFVSRLLEEEGIFYFFEHEDDKHTMVLADHPGIHAPCQGQEIANFKLSGGDYFGDEDQISSLKMVKEIQAGKFSLNDYNYEIPNTDLKVTSDTTHPLGPGEREKYDYPGEYVTRSEGDNLSTLRMEEEEARITTLSGSSDCRAFVSGFRFKLENTSRDDWNSKEYLLTRVRHEADQAATYFTGATAAGKEKAYINHFECIPHEVPFRPMRRTRRPVVEGVQTAFVVGPSGEEIHTDDYGRVKVQFHWDREGEFNEDSSCWLRVSQSMAGNGWGALFLPRIGHEVVVEFIEGNPDRPIITGQVYHGVNRPPYKLPDEKTKSTFKSNSSPDGGGFNEIRFEDKSGKEQIFIHGERNLDIRIKSDRFETIGNDCNLVVENDKKEHIKNDRHELVDVNHKEEIGGDRHLTIAGKQALMIGDKSSVTVGGDVAEEFGGNHSETVGGDYYVKSGGKLVLEAGSNITLKVGGSSIAIDNSGITINSSGIVEVKGSMIKLN
ncbi:MAG: type VI secretion system tip protein VgrG [Desulfobulbaceae bacterium]|nr:type VI secretion system tip protein VgrG [Desulfobulbaceae bacterium]